MYTNVQRKSYAGYFSKFIRKGLNFLKVFDEYGNLSIGAPGSFNTCFS